MSFPAARSPISVAAVFTLVIGMAATGCLAIWLAGAEYGASELAFRNQTSLTQRPQPASPYVRVRALPERNGEPERAAYLQAPSFETVAGARPAPAPAIAPEGRHPFRGSWLALLGGALATLLVALGLQILASRNARLARANALLSEDIVERREAEQLLRHSQAELRGLAAHQARAREEERKRVAREIRDELGQNLLALRLDLAAMEMRTAALDPELNDRIGLVLDQVDTTVKSVRAIINNLRPPVLELGLQAALEWLIAQFEEHHDIACTLAIDHSGLDTTLDDERSTAIFRIVEELLGNAARHAHASRIEIGLHRRDGRLFISLADNGRGFPDDRRKPRSFGLVAIRERILALGGEFRIEGVAGKGTTVMFSVSTEASVEHLAVPESEAP